MSQKLTKHGENMSDQEIEANEVQKETIDIKKTSFINSLFFSTGTIVGLAIVFIATTFISGWYIFTLSDREKQIVRNEDWINAHENIIISARDHQQQLTVLMDSIPRLASRKRILHTEIDDQNTSLTSMKSEYDR